MSVHITIANASFALSKDQLAFDAPNKLAEFHNTVLNVSVEYFATLAAILKGRPEILDRCAQEEAYHVWALARRFQLPKICAYFEWRLGTARLDQDEAGKDCAETILMLLPSLGIKEQEMPSLAQIASLKLFSNRSVHQCPAWASYFAKQDPLPEDIQKIRQQPWDAIKVMTKAYTNLFLKKDTFEERLKTYLPLHITDPKEMASFWDWMKHGLDRSDLSKVKSVVNCAAAVDLSKAKSAAECAAAVDNLVNQYFRKRFDNMNLEERVKAFIPKLAQDYFFWETLQELQGSLNYEIITAVSNLKHAEGEKDIREAVSALVEKVQSPTFEELINRHVVGQAARQEFWKQFELRKHDAAAAILIQNIKTDGNNNKEAVTHLINYMLPPTPTYRQQSKYDAPPPPPARDTNVIETSCSIL